MVILRAGKTSPRADWLWVNSSAAPPACATTTGLLHAIASMIVSPNGSGWVLACTTMSKARYRSASAVPDAKSSYGETHFRDSLADADYFLAVARSLLSPPA